MASTALDLDIDSPMGPHGKASNGPVGTAKVSEVIGLFRGIKHFPRAPVGKGSAPNRVLSIDFDDAGELLLTSESDNTMQIYNVKEGKHQKACLSQKYGANNAIFGHASSCIIHSSTKVNHTIRYLSTHDNSYVRYFEGHTENVTCLAMHPGDDQFLSLSEDNTIRLWDTGSKNGAWVMEDVIGAYLAAWDPSGTVFAVASPATQSILLYDIRNVDKPPFATFDLAPITQQYSPSVSGQNWNKLAFSNDGKSILVGTTSSGHFVLDAFTGSIKAYLNRPLGGAPRLGAGEHNIQDTNLSNSEYKYPTTGDAAFSPDGRYVISGSRDNKVLVWDMLGAILNKSLAPVHEIACDPANHQAAVVAWNPRYNFFATGDKEVVFWTPNLDGY